MFKDVIEKKSIKKIIKKYQLKELEPNLI